jgi:hypothetical protein
MDQGIIQCVKLKYRKKQLQFLIKQMDKFSKTGSEILSNFKSHSLKIKEFIHALVLFLYITGKFSDFIFPKHLGFLDLPIMRGSNFSHSLKGITLSSVPCRVKGVM